MKKDFIVDNFRGIYMPYGIYKISYHGKVVNHGKKYEKRVSVKESDKVVSFSCDGTPLFDILFNSDDGVLIGTYKNVSVSLKNYKVKGDELLAMQEGANDVLAHLYEDKSFKSK